MKNFMNCLTGTTFAFLFLLPTLAATVHAQQPIAVSGPYTLTLPMINDDIAVTRFAARRPLTVTEQTQVTMIDMAQFRREPGWSYQTLRREAADLKALRRMDPVRLAEWRETAVTSTYFHRDSHVTPEENTAYLALYTRTNPVVNADRASGTVVTERDMDAWLAAAHEVAVQTHTQPAATRAIMLDALQDPTFNKASRVRAANMEKNWAAYRLCWAHEPPADQHAQALAMTRHVHRYAAQGQTGGAQAGDALTLASSAAGDYPYALDPRFAVLKSKIIAQILIRGQANSNMIMDQAIRENGRLMRNGVQERGGLASHAGDESPAPFHYPATP